MMEKFAQNVLNTQLPEKNQQTKSENLQNLSNETNNN